MVRQPRNAPPLGRQENLKFDHPHPAVNTAPSEGSPKTKLHLLQSVEQSFNCYLVRLEGLLDPIWFVFLGGVLIFMMLVVLFSTPNLGIGILNLVVSGTVGSFLAGLGIREMESRSKSYR